MGLESIFKLSVVMNMIDNLSSPMASITGRMDATTEKLNHISQGFGNIASTGVAMAGVGMQITQAVLDPVEATFETQRAIGELASLGVKDLGTVEAAAKQFSDTWAGTTKADFISAAYDIKSGIASLSDEGVAGFTELSGITATATKSTIGEMTDLFATGYGIYKDFYSDLSDMEFGEMFSSGISTSVKNFKTSGSGMAQAIKTLGASAATAQVPLEEQLSVLGMLQATMSGSEAGTKYKAFLRSATKGGEALGLSFTDANNQLLSMPEIMELLRGKFGETMDAAEKMELQKAFGDTEAVALIDLMYNKTGDLQTSILDLYDSMGQGKGSATEMADAINGTSPAQYEILKQQINNVKQSIGNSLLPTINEYLKKGSELAAKVSIWVESHQSLVSVIMTVVLILGIFLTVGGTVIAVVGGIGLIFTRTVGSVRGFITIVKLVPGAIETMQIKAMYASDSIVLAFTKIKAAGTRVIASVKSVALSILNFAKTAAINGAMAVKNFVLGMVGMAKQAIMTAVTALPGLIAAVWSFTAALLANPITWIVIGIVALIAGLILLWKNWDAVVVFIKGVWDSFINGIIDGFNWIKDKISSLPIGFQLLIAAVFPFIGIPMLIINHWDSIAAFFTGLWTKIKTSFTNGINNIKEFMNGIPAWFKNSGKKIMETFSEGILGAITAPVKAVKKGLSKIRQMLPFSDAKEGPLSTLTLSGRRVLETVTTGIHQREDMPADAVEKSFSKVDLTTTKKGIAKINLSETLNGKASANKEAEVSADSSKNVIIQKLIMNVDISKLKNLKDLMKLVAEMEDYNNANGEISSEDAAPAFS